MIKKSVIVIATIIASNPGVEGVVLVCVVCDVVGVGDCVGVRVGVSGA